MVLGDKMKLTQHFRLLKNQCISLHFPHLFLWKILKCISWDKGKNASQLSSKFIPTRWLGWDGMNKWSSNYKGFLLYCPTPSMIIPLIIEYVAVFHLEYIAVFWSQLDSCVLVSVEFWFWVFDIVPPKIECYLQYISCWNLTFDSPWV